jgi:alpha-glucosidase
MPPALALRPHHDGSELYVANQRPKLGENVKLRVRVHRSLGDVKRILIRQSDSGEAFLANQAKRFMNRHGWVWFEGQIAMHNPELHYRFFIELKSGENYWLNATGLHPLDRPDSEDFTINTYSSAPNWAAKSVMYQIFPDRFARSAAAEKHPAPEWAKPAEWSDTVIGKGPGVSQQFFGGDLIGAAEHLNHLKKLGANILYITPFFPGRSNHRYDASTFDSVDPLLGGNRALSALVEKAHAMGIKVMGDLTANHTGAGHEWFQAAFGKPGAAESEFYYFTEGNKKYDSWWGVASLPKLNWSSAELRKRFVQGKTSVVAKWLKPPYNLDGWRIDVANMTGRIRDTDLNREVGRLIRETVQLVRSDALLIGEFTKDASSQVVGDSYQGAMTYANFTAPVWRWLANPAEKREEQQLGPGRKGIGANDLIELHTRFSGTMPWHVRKHNLNTLDTHDTGRFKTFALPGSQRVAAGLQFTLPGIPMIFAGDEFGLEGVNGEASRTPIPWNNERPNSTEMIATYAALAAIRKKQRALTEGSLRWLYASNEALAFARETKTDTVLVIASRGKDRRVEFSAEALPSVLAAENLFGGGNLRAVGTKIRYDATALDLQIWRLPSAVR